MHQTFNINIHSASYIYLQKTKTHKNMALGLQNMHQTFNINIYSPSYIYIPPKNEDHKNISLRLQNMHQTFNINIHSASYIYLQKTKTHKNMALGLQNMHQTFNINIHSASYIYIYLQKTKTHKIMALGLQNMHQTFPVKRPYEFVTSARRGAKPTLCKRRLPSIIELRFGIEDKHQKDMCLKVTMLLYDVLVYKVTMCILKNFNANCTCDWLWASSGRRLLQESYTI